MKNILFKLFCLFLILSSQISDLSAQNINYNKGFSTRALFMDYQSQNGGDITAFRNYHHGYEFAYHQRINDNVKFVLPVNVGQVRSHADLDCVHKTIYGLGGQVQYEFGNNRSNVVPYILGGLDFVTETDSKFHLGEFNMQAPLGFGLNFKIEDRGYFFWQSDYRVSFKEDRNNLHHGFGFVYLWDGMPGMDTKKDDKDKKNDLDSDGDGITNDLDLCPSIAGSKELNGCPDTDGDGVADYEDDCPTVAGKMDGCPDSDGDGVSDQDDDCPNLAGIKANKGCPDADRDGDGVPDSMDNCPDIKGTTATNGCPGGDGDNDGIPDTEDKCPTQYGVASANGCPDSDGDGVADYEDKCPNKAGLNVYSGCPDSDGDGIDDSRDRCPYKAGSVATNGCPEIDREDRRVLELAMRAVQFDTGKSTLKSESYDVLKQISNILVKYPNYKLSIEGHTDSVGSADANQRLSERRAKACYDYLVSLGISSNRISYIGYGEVKPISDNNSLRGKALNRRTEFTLSPM